MHIFKHYIQLMRLNKPIGILLLLWPTLWALWLAGNGQPNLGVVVVFILGVIIMRSAGCIINDVADKKFDKHVERTRNRPLTTGKIKTKGALILFFCLLLSAFFLILLLNRLTLYLAFVGVLLAVLYPFMKRFTHLPQLGLGLAFAWGVPMAFAAINQTVSQEAWVLFVAAAIWPVIYDTMYAMVDYADDIKIGVKSTAVAWGRASARVIACLQIIFILLLVWCGFLFNLGKFYFLSLFIVGLLFIYQQLLIKNNLPQACFRAFLNNQWVGMAVFIGIYLA